ncbi:MAG: hypothetical protein AAGI72_22240 [Pseudomonadota bacterium]
MKRLLIVLALLLLIVVGLLAWFRFANPPEPFPAGSESADRVRDGPWPIKRLDEDFVDRDRATPPNGSFPGSPERHLPGSVWYPEGAGPRPLLLFSHGFTSMRQNGRYLAEHLASHGYVVVAVDYPLTSYGAPGGARFEDVVAQPGDLSFLIDTLASFSSTPDHPLSGGVDATRVGVFGISLGGLTSTLAGFHPELRDPRVGAVLNIAGPTNFFTPRFFAQADIPLLVLSGELDALVPWSSNAEPVPLKAPGARLVTVRGGSHTGFSHGTAWLRMMKNTDAVGCYSVTRYVDANAASDSEGLLGTPAQGLDYNVPDELCKVDPLPQTIDVLRQQMIARVVARAFFDSVFALDDAERRAAGRYLEVTLDLELDDVKVSAGN